VNIRRFIPALILGTAGCQAAAPPPDFAAVFDGTGGRWVDLTHPFSEESIFWPTAQGFRHERVAYGVTEGGWFYANNNFSLSEHGGTHFDAPIHFAEGGDHAEEVPLERLLGPAAVVDVRERVHPDYQVSVEDLQGWEARHGPIPPGAILLFQTGWGERWPDPLLVLGTELKGAEAVPELHFPGIHPEAARWLVENRDVAAVGIDTPSLDYGQSATFETHRILFARNIPAFENVAHLDELPEWGSFVVALPMKIQGGSGGPLRIVAFLPH